MEELYIKLTSTAWNVQITGSSSEFLGFIQRGCQRMRILNELLLVETTRTCDSLNLIHSRIRNLYVASSCSKSCDPRDLYRKQGCSQMEGKNVKGGSRKPAS